MKENYNTVSKMLEISTAHITPDTYIFLERTYDKDDLNDDNFVYPKDDIGLFIYIYEGMSEDDIPNDLKDCVKKAIELDCDWIMFDIHASEIKTLPTYHDEWYEAY